MRTACLRLCIRTPAAPLAAGLVALCLAGAAPIQAQRPGHPVSSGRLHLWGTVSDQMTEGPVEGARLRLIHVASGVEVATAETGYSGSFTFVFLAEGRYELRVDRLGYQGLVDTLSLSEGTDGLTDVVLVPAALSLTPVVVDVARRDRSPLREFEQRRARGIGSFVTRSEIEDRHPARITDMFRTVSAVRVVSDARGDARLLLRGRCAPQLYIDGMPAFGGLSLDVSLAPDDVEGIEVYSTGTAPAQYARDACGVVLVWTRVPERTEGRGSWRRGLVVAGALLGVILLTR